MSPATPTELRNPFPGLRPYRESDSANYFGQDQQIEDLLARLGKSRFLAVVGVSGSGKSSLVQAGLFAQLRKMSGGARPRWHIAICRPGIDPVGNLAKALEGLGLPRKVEALPYLRRSARGVIDYADAAGIESDQRLLVVADQFEEIFRYQRTDPSVKRQDNAAVFVRLLLEAAGENSSCYAAITMRADFLGDCSLFYGLAEKINQGIYLVPKVQRKQLREMIEKPVQHANVGISPVLVERLLGESEEREDGLPLMQHALMRIWTRWAARAKPGEPIAEQDFELERGPGVARPLIELHLDRHLDSIYDSLSPEGQIFAERIFKLLSERDFRGREVRRAVGLNELAKGLKTEPENLLPVIDAFRDESQGRTFLMPPKGEGAPGDPIDISHECLLRQWTRLRNWVQEEARDAAQFQRIADSADTAGPSEFLTGRSLEVYWEWWERFQPTPEWASRYEGPVDAGLSTRSRSYVAAKRYLLASWEDKRKQEAERLRAQKRLFHWKVAAVAIGMAALVGLASWGIEHRIAENNQQLLLKEQAVNNRLLSDTIQITAAAEAGKKSGTEQETHLVEAARSAQTALLQTRVPSANVSIPHVFPQYWTDAQKNFLAQITPKLKGPDLAIEAPQKVTVGPSATELRYFQKEMPDDPGKIARIAGKLKDAGLTATPVYVPGFDKISPNQFELWLPKPRVTVVYPGDSLKSKAVDIAGSLTTKSYSAEARPLDRTSEAWKFESPIEVHYFFQSGVEPTEAANIAALLSSKGYAAKSRFVPTEKGEPQMYFEVWLEGQ